MLNLHQHNYIRVWATLLAVVACALLIWGTALVPHAHAEDGFMDFLDGTVIKWVGWLVYAIALGIGGLFVGIGGLALDITLRLTVIEMGNFFSGGYGLGIIQVWQIIRDLFNILFIFAFIYLGIKTILNSDDSGTRRAIGHIIIAALFINFSLFITQAIVDFSNIAATQIYNQAVSRGQYTDQFLITGPQTISGAFLTISDLTTFFGSSNLLNDMKGSQIIVYSILMMTFLVLAGIVFLFAAFHVLYRFVALSIYMILSPVLFLGLILPKFQGYTDKWVRGLLKQSFFAPAFLFLVYVSLMALERLKDQLDFGVASKGYSVVKDGIKMTADGFTIFVFFGIVIGFLYASVKVGEMMSIAGANTAVKSIHGVRKGAQDMLYRNTVGRGFSWGMNRLDSINRIADSEKGTPGRRAAILARTFMGGRAGSEAIRGNMDRAANYGGREARENAIKANTQRSARANAIHNITTDLRSGDRIKQERAIADASSPQLLEMIKEDEGKDLIMENAGRLSKSQYEAIVKSEDIDDEFRKKLAQRRGEQITQRLIEDNRNKDGSETKLEHVIGKADTSELEAIGFEKVKTVAGKLSARQIDDWKDLTPTEKNQLKGERKRQLDAEFKENPGKLFERITSDEERSKLPDSILTDEKAIPYLNTNVLTKIVDNNSITAGQRAEIKERVLNHYNTSEVKAYESAHSQYEKDMREYRKLEPDVRRKTDEPTPPTKHKDVVNYERINEWFEKNGAGQRY